MNDFTVAQITKNGPWEVPIATESNVLSAGNKQHAVVATFLGDTETSVEPRGD